MKILIIDDTKAVHAFVNALLSRGKGIQTVSAYNGAEGLVKLRESGDFDLVLLDWEMPIMNGPEAFAEMKKLNLKTPTIMMTTKNATEDISMMIEMGVVDYMMKPFTIDILFEKIAWATGKEISYAA